MAKNEKEKKTKQIKSGEKATDELIRLLKDGVIDAEDIPKLNDLVELLGLK